MRVNKKKRYGRRCKKKDEGKRQKSRGGEGVFCKTVGWKVASKGSCAAQGMIKEEIIGREETKKFPKEMENWIWGSIAFGSTNKCAKDYGMKSKK